jgi:hypothetical protein
MLQLARTDTTRGQNSVLKGTQLPPTTARLLGGGGEKDSPFGNPVLLIIELSLFVQL